MKKLNVLLVCGSGASSGFMAANMRKAAKEREIDITVTARSEAEIENYIDEIDEILQGSQVKHILMKPEYYSTLDGNKALDHLLSTFQ